MSTSPATHEAAARKKSVSRSNGKRSAVAGSNGHTLSNLEASLYDLQAEKGVLGTIVLAAVDPRYHDIIESIFTKVQARDFFDGANEKVFGHLFELHRTSEIDPILLIARLKSSGDYEAVGGRPYVDQLFSAVPNVAHGNYYADIVRDKADVRRLLALQEQVAESIQRGKSSDEVAALMRQELDRLQPTRSHDDFELLTCEDVEASPEEEYLAEGLIVKGQPGIIGAPYKGMKTSTCCDLVLALATGGSVLGKFPCPRAVKVLFMSGESGLSTLKRTARSICQARGIQWPQDVPNLRWSRMLPMMGEDGDLRRLDRTYRKFQFEVLVIDPTYKAMSGVDASNLMIQGEKLMHLQRWCEAHGVTLILVHHLTKPSAKSYQPAELGDLSHSGFAEHVRWWILLSRRERYVPPDPVHRLWVSVGGSAGHSGLWEVDIDNGKHPSGQGRNWEVRIEEASEAREQKAAEKAAAKRNAAQQRREGYLQEVLRALKMFPEGETQTGIRDATSLNSAQVKNAIQLGVQLKKIESCDVYKGAKRKPLPGFRAVDRAHWAKSG